MVKTMGIGKQGQASRLNEKAVKEDAKNAFINAKREAFMQRKKLIDQQSGYLLCGISGDPGTGKRPDRKEDPCGQKSRQVRADCAHWGWGDGRGLFGPPAGVHELPQVGGGQAYPPPPG